MANPPKRALRFLRWFCREDCLDELEGDLTEMFAEESKNSPRTARWKFAWRVLKCLRPEFIKSFEVGQHAGATMYTSYLKIGWRNVLKNSTFSMINIVGLSVSMAVGLFLIAVISDISSYDRFHENYSTIYRVISKYEYLGNKDNNYNATTSLVTARAIRESFTGFESMAVLRRGFSGDVTWGETTIPLSGYFANETVFNVFTFPFIEGNPATALKEPFTAVLTESSSKKLFGTETALGSVIRFNNNDYTITGVIRDIPEFSHMHFDLLGSLSTRAITEKLNKRELAWDNIWNTWVYVTIPDKDDLPAFQESLALLSAREDKTVKNTHIELSLQSLGNIMTGDDLSNQIGRTLGKTLVMVFFGLTAVVILSACFNYTNLSVARSFRRSREIGIRKVIGAARGQVRTQFIIEAVIISVLSLVAAILLFQVLKPYFLGLNPDLSELLKLELSPSLLLFFVAFAVGIGMAAGVFPGLYFSRVNPALILKGQAMRVVGNLTGRRALIVVQYCISLMLITATLIMYRQYKHFLNFDLGFNTKGIVNIRMQGNKPGALVKELRELPEVRNVAQAAIVTSVGTVWGEMMRNPTNPSDSAGIRVNYVDENYLPLLDHQLLAGRNFVFRPEHASIDEVIVNEQVLKRFDIADQIPSQAIG
ncbi:MAG TPA: ABC transporter permease, partial [Cyclobacteriaceae bacterium]|nr:ABC transporter permease [Cyclobacteriaceae bacterium]